MGTIYKITNIVTNQVYIGQASDVKARFKDYSLRLAKGQPLLNQSLLKYGLINHKFEIVCTCLDSISDQLEIYFIKHYESFFYKHKSKGLNLTRGGRRGSAHPEETKKKIAKSLTGKKQSKETIDKKKIKNSKAILVYDGELTSHLRFSSLVECGDHFGISDNGVRGRVASSKVRKRDYYYIKESELPTILAQIKARIAQ